MNKESILSQFDKMQWRIRRAKLPFETDMLHEEVLKVTLYELLHSKFQIEALIEEISRDKSLNGLTPITAGIAIEKK